MTFGGFHKKKRRSKQKNLKKDTRPENLRPGGADYVPLTERPGYVPPPAKEEPTELLSETTEKKEETNSEYADKPLNCRDCAEVFMFTIYEQKGYKKKGFETMPTRCKRCRESKRQRDDDSNNNNKDQQPKNKKVKKSEKRNVTKSKKFKNLIMLNEEEENEIIGDKKNSPDEEVESDEAPDEETNINMQPTENKQISENSDDDEKEDNKKDEEDDDSDDDSDDDEEKNHEKENDVDVVEEDEYEYWNEEDNQNHQKWDERDEVVCSEILKPFDLFEALEITPDFILEDGQVKGGTSRLRSQYHKLSMRYHPDSFKPKRSGNVTSVPTQRSSAEQHFRRVAIAFETLKDPARAAIFATHGFEGLEKSESFGEYSILDTRPFARFDAFFDGSDPDDREYLLLEAASGGNFSDEDDAGEVTEAEDDDDDEHDDTSEDEDEDEDEMLQNVMKECQKESKRLKEESKTNKQEGAKILDRLPMPPAGVGGALITSSSMNDQSSPPSSSMSHDPFARIASEIKRSSSKTTKTDVVKPEVKVDSSTSKKSKKKSK
mmetsp:Transcript_34089/g.43981  ORF Transcript_34089/g.43981 Transcript_34089/m.43981 type:complete len:548 (-) Transcript_34089:168-1811(-)